MEDNSSGREKIDVSEYENYEPSPEEIKEWDMMDEAFSSCSGCRNPHCPDCLANCSR